LEDTLLRYLHGDLRRIAEVAGVEAAVRISLALGGNVVYVPALGDLHRLARDERIRREFRGGKTVRALSRSFGLTERSIWRILNKAGPRLGPELVSLLEGGRQEAGD
jgi:Mor family transcriptional regulator